MRSMMRNDTCSKTIRQTKVKPDLENQRVGQKFGTYRLQPNFHGVD